MAVILRRTKAVMFLVFGGSDFFSIIELCVVEARDGTISVASAFAGHQQGMDL